MTAGEQPEARIAPDDVLGANPGPIGPDDRFPDAGRKAMWPHVGRILALEPALRDPADTDAIRRYRVATRRLRAALRAFRDAYPPDAVRPLQKHLGDFARDLGEVRDLDVRIAGLEAWAAKQGADTPGLVGPLLKTWQRQRRRSAGALQRDLAAKRHARLLASLVAFVAPASAEEAVDASPALIVRDRVASSIWLAYERVRAYAGVIASADVPTLHALRVDAKRLRYLLEFLGDVLGPEKTWLIERLVALQDELGILSDAEVAAAAARAFVADHGKSLRDEEQRAIRAYIEARDRDLAGVRRGIGRPWRPIVSVTFARRLGRAVIVEPSPTAPSRGRGRARGCATLGRRGARKG